MNITSGLSDFISSLHSGVLPEKVIQRTKYLLLDAIGNAIRARRDSESTPALMSAIKHLGMDNGNAHVFGDDKQYSPAGATLINGVMIHSLDFDDTHAAAIVHPAAPIIPSALAAAELTGATGMDLVTAIVAGYETALRIALALPAGAHYDRGFHPTATCGVFGAAAAAANVLQLTAEQTASALGIALSQSSGSLQFLNNGAWTKRFQVGWASMAGFTAALLARDGFIGASFPIEGKHGFLNAYSPTPNPERILQDLGHEWELMNTGVKPYPSCRWGHAGIDAALALRSEHRFCPDDIESVTLGVSKAAMLLIGEPADKKSNPQNIVNAQFSGPFVIATALLTGKMDWNSYSSLKCPDIHALMKRIHCQNDPDIEAEFPANMSGKLTIVANGQHYIKTIIVPKGDPDNFLSENEFLNKFSSLTADVIGIETSSMLAEQILSIDELDDLSFFINQTSKQQ